MLDSVREDGAGRTSIAVGGGLAQQKDGEGLVAVECAVVSADDLERCQLGYKNQNCVITLAIFCRLGSGRVDMKARENR